MCGRKFARSDERKRHTKVHIKQKGNRVTNGNNNIVPPTNRRLSGSSEGSNCSTSALQNFRAITGDCGGVGSSTLTSM